MSVDVINGEEICGSAVAEVCARRWCLFVVGIDTKHLIEGASNRE